MMQSERLAENTKLYLMTKANEIFFKPNGYREVIDIDKISVAIAEPGLFTGYYLLNGSNVDYGGYEIHGSAEKRSSCLVHFDMSYRWNDFMDPDENDPLDPIFNFIAEGISLGRAEPFVFRIKWDAESLYDYEDIEKSSGWPFEMK